MRAKPQSIRYYPHFMSYKGISQLLRMLIAGARNTSVSECFMRSLVMMQSLIRRRRGEVMAIDVRYTAPGILLYYKRLYVKHTIVL